MIKGKKSGLSKRYQVSYENKGGNSNRNSVLDYSKIDGEIEFFAPKEGRNRINIIPYEIKTKNHPLVKKGEMEVGDIDYVMDIWVHKNVGPAEKNVICLKNTFGKPCPICEHASMLRKKGEEDEAKNLKPSRRVIYNVEDLKEPGKVKVFETSHYLFEKELIDEARDDEEGGFINFADPEEGKEIKFRASKTSQGGFEFNEYKSFSFEDREEPLSKKLLSKAISFDEILNIPTSEEVEKIFFGNADDEEEVEEKEEPKKPAKKDEDDEEDEPKSISKKMKEESEEQEEKPKKAESKSDDEEKEEPKKPAKKCSGCPFGHVFGDDCDNFDDCDDCDQWDKCASKK